jgi:glycosyltransferase involved in cell wall biosynthesis
MSLVDFTIAIPTYNGEQRLPDVLERLRSQIGTESLSIEVFIIDNNSQDNTAQVVQAYQQDFPYPIYYILERQQGAAFARKRAIQEAKSELVGFLDDDNLPALDWITTAYRFAQEHPLAGAYGSRIEGDFEAELPQGFQRLTPYLAITERGSVPLRYEPKHRLLPPSAGLVVRRTAWLESVPRTTILSGRVSGNMLTGEDLEVIAYIQQAGWEIWYNADMKITHKIPHWRLERSYLLSFFRGVGLSRFVTRTLNFQPWQRPWMAFAYSLNDLRKIVIHLLKHGTQVKTDLVAACELELLLSSLISPFYLYRNGYLQRKPRQNSEVKSAYSQTLL